MELDPARENRGPPQTREAASSINEPSMKESIMTERRDHSGQPAWWEDETGDGAWANAWCPSWETAAERAQIHTSKPAELRFAAPDPGSAQVQVFETFLTSERSTFLGA
jgi:hypothetical protein